MTEDENRFGNPRLDAHVQPRCEPVVVIEAKRGIVTAQSLRKQPRTKKCGAARFCGSGKIGFVDFVDFDSNPPIYFE